MQLKKKIYFYKNVNEVYCCRNESKYLNRSKQDQSYKDPKIAQ